MYVVTATMDSPHTYKRCESCNLWYLENGEYTPVPPIGFGTRLYAEHLVTCSGCLN